MFCLLNILITYLNSLPYPPERNVFFDLFLFNFNLYFLSLRQSNWLCPPFRGNLNRRILSVGQRKNLSADFPC